MEIVLIVVIGVVLWYFGSTLARAAETANNLADTRLEDLEGEQIVVSAIRRAKTTKKAKKLVEKGDVHLSNKELRDLLRNKSKGE